MTNPDASFALLLQHVTAWFEAHQREAAAALASETAISGSDTLSEVESVAAMLPVEQAERVTDKAHRMAMATARRLHRSKAFQTLLTTKAPGCDTPGSVIDFLYSCVEEGRELRSLAPER